MTKGEKDKVINFMDRGSWQYSSRMERDQWGNIDMRHPDNIKKVRDHIKEELHEARILVLKANEIEKIMNQSNGRLLV